MSALQGRAHRVGDNVDTDRIIPGKYTKTLDTSDLAKHVLEDYDAGLAGRVAPGDVLVAGENFGCGSSREQAPLALKAAGFSCVVAHSFARIFYRNAINIGLPLVEVPDHDIREGHQVRVELVEGRVIDEGPQGSEIAHAAAAPEGAANGDDAANAKAAAPTATAATATAPISYRATRMPEVMTRILEAGGLVPFLKEHGDYVEKS